MLEPLQKSNLCNFSGVYRLLGPRDSIPRKEVSTLFSMKNPGIKLTDKLQNDGPSKITRVWHFYPALLSNREKWFDPISELKVFWAVEQPVGGYLSS